MLRVLRAVDKANGYVFGDTEERSLQQMLSCAVGAEFEYEKIHTVQEKFVDEHDIDQESEQHGVKAGNTGFGWTWCSSDEGHVIVNVTTKTSYLVNVRCFV